MIRDSLKSMDGKCRWVPHEKNPADGLTKLKGNVSTLMHLIRTHKYRLVEEKKEMEERAEYRERTGQRNPRPKKAYYQSVADPLNPYPSGTSDASPPVTSPHPADSGSRPTSGCLDSILAFTASTGITSACDVAAQVNTPDNSTTEYYSIFDGTTDD